jgi:hypothetical protein
VTGLLISMQGSGIRSLADAMAAIGDAKAKRAYARGINRVGAGAITHTARALAKQTGLKVGVTRKALSNPVRATPARLEFFKRVRGGDIALKHFAARETLRGASAAPFAQRRVFGSHFIKGGLFPQRVGLKMSGHVMDPDTGTSRWGRPFKVAQSGVILPEQLLQGQSKAAFEAQAERLAPRIEHEIRVITKGVVS